MKTVAIVAEYNPFHLGHARQYAAVKEQFGDDCRIVVIMSGPFVQRGEPAILSREDRTEACLKAGASLVLELPLPFATASAADFALASVQLLKASGICRDLVCGAETAHEKEAFRELAAFLSEEPQKFKKYLQDYLAEGLNFAAAREAAVAACFPERAELFREILSKPNNILALEYHIAAEKLNKKIKDPRQRLKLHLLPRRGDERRKEADLSGEEVNATSIRHILASESSKAKRLLLLEKQLPPHVLAMLLERPLVPAGKETLLLAEIMSSRTNEELLPYRYMEEGLIGRLRKACEKLAAEKEAEDIWKAAATRYYSQTRYKRALLSWALGIKKEDWEKMQAEGPAFIRVLGCDKHGRYLLRLMRKLAELPRVDKASDLLENLHSPLATAGIQQALALGGDRLYRALRPEKSSVFDSYIQIR